MSISVNGCLYMYAKLEINHSHTLQYNKYGNNEPGDEFASANTSIVEETLGLLKY
jgi:hypothetical protein